MVTKYAKQQKGVALVSALVFLVITVIFVGTALLVSSANRRLSATNVAVAKAQLNAEAAIEQLIYDIWYSDTVLDDNKPYLSRDLQMFRKGLDALGIRAAVQTENAYPFGPAYVDSQDSEDVNYTLSVRRVDLGSSRTLLRLEVIGRSGASEQTSAERRISEDIAIQPPDLPGFALLTNNANCIFCHTLISSLDVAYAEDGKPNKLRSANFNAEAHMLNKDRIKVGVLESLESHRTNIDSLVTGTIYTRGKTNILDLAADLYLAPFLENSSKLSAKPFSKQFQASDCAAGCSEKNQLFYTHYPLQHANPPDGKLPDRFPLPVADSNGNRLIDDQEWRKAIVESSKLGAVKGGEKTLYATGIGIQNRDGSVSLSSTDSPQGVPGHVILKGSDYSPLILEDDVYIDGDVVISGRITGSGRLIARGNVYVVGDIRYACDDNAKDAIWTNPKPCNYGQKQSLPEFALVAGKNMMVGPYMMQHLGTPTDPNNTVYPIPAEHLSRTDFAGISQDELYRWYLDPGYWPDDEAGNPLRTAHRNQGDYRKDASYTTSFSMAEIALFNQLEYEKASADSSYRPRYYRMREDSPVFRCISTAATGCRYYGNTDYLQTGDTDSSNLPNPELINMTEMEPERLLSAALLSLTPSGAWLANGTANAVQDSELFLRNEWVKNVEINGRSPVDPALQLDGIFYSGNAIFTLAPSKSAIAGQLRVHGSIIAADTGILVPGQKGCNSNCEALSIFYDSRLKTLLDIQDEQKLVQIRSGFHLLAQGSPSAQLYEDIPFNSVFSND